MACKGAVKANEKLESIEIKNILKKLSQLKTLILVLMADRQLLKLQNMN